MRVNHAVPWLFSALCLASCSVEPRSGRVSPEDIWTEEPEPEPKPPALPFADREEGKAYGLPRRGAASMADLIDLFPKQALGADDPDIFVAPGVEVATDQCRGGEVVTLEGLPITVEGVITLFPRQYMKIPICGQDERHYGVYTVEDDTGGLVVLRDSRVASFGHGDRVKLTVSGITLTYGADIDTRAVLIADVEPTGETGPVMFRRTDEAFTIEDVGQVHRVEGYVWQEPSNDNFSELVLANQVLEGGVELEELRGDALACALSCEPKCGRNCDKKELCAPACAELCANAGPGEKLDESELPVCWIVGLASELGKRGLTYPRGDRLRVTGPVVNNYERQIWVLDPGQVETLPQ